MLCDSHDLNLLYSDNKDVSFSLVFDSDSSIVQHGSNHRFPHLVVVRQILGDYHRSHDFVDVSL